MCRARRVPHHVAPTAMRHTESRALARLRSSRGAAAADLNVPRELDRAPADR